MIDTFQIGSNRFVLSVRSTRRTSDRIMKLDDLLRSRRFVLDYHPKKHKRSQIVSSSIRLSAPLFKSMFIKLKFASVVVAAVVFALTGNAEATTCKDVTKSLSVTFSDSTATSTFVDLEVAASDVTVEVALYGGFTAFSVDTNAVIDSTGLSVGLELTTCGLLSVLGVIQGCCDKSESFILSADAFNNAKDGLEVALTLSLPIGTTCVKAATGTVTISYQSCSGADGGGDPHFTTFGQEHFDFQGECDLLLINNPSFMDGVGMTVHGRTKLHGSWSAFEAAAIKIGDDVLEVHGESPPILNGIEYPVQEIERSEYNFPMKFGGYSLTAQYLGPHSRRHIIHFGNGEKIFINNFKEFVDFEVESPHSSEFAGSVGLLGSYNTGTKLARDGTTVIDDADEFGQEWQVRVDDTQLFSVIDGPQYPAKCNMPTKMSAVKRHLRAMTKKVSEDQAKQACAKAPARRMENCIADVFGSDNFDMAGIYVL